MKTLFNYILLGMFILIVGCSTPCGAQQQTSRNPLKGAFAQGQPCGRTELQYGYSSASASSRMEFITPVTPDPGWSWREKPIRQSQLPDKPFGRSYTRVQVGNTVSESGRDSSVTPYRDIDWNTGRQVVRTVVTTDEHKSFSRQPEDRYGMVNDPNGPKGGYVSGHLPIIPQFAVPSGRSSSGRRH